MNDNDTAQADARIAECNDAAINASMLAVEASINLQSDVADLWRAASIAYLRLAVAIQARHGAYSGHPEMTRAGERAALAFDNAEGYSRIMETWRESGGNKGLRAWLTGSEQ